MPVKHFASLLGLWLACLIVAMITASAGNGIYAYIPAGRHHSLSPVISPPNDLLILIHLILIGGFILFTQFWAVWFSVALGVGLILGTFVGLLGADWSPGPGQYALTALMFGLACYSFKLRDYLD